MSQFSQPSQPGSLPIPPHLCGPTAEAEVYDSRGVDRSVIRWMLSLTPEERLQVVQNAVSSLHETPDDRH